MKRKPTTKRATKGRIKRTNMPCPDCGAKMADGGACGHYCTAPGCDHDTFAGVRPVVQRPAHTEYLRSPNSMLEGLSALSGKAKLFRMLEHAVAVAEAWKMLSQQAQAQEQRTYLAFVKATRG